MKSLRQWLARALGGIAAVAALLGCSPSITDVATVPQIVVGNLTVPITTSNGTDIFIAFASEKSNFVFNQGLTASKATAADGTALPLPISTSASTWSFAAPANAPIAVSTLFKKSDGSVAKVNGNLSFGPCTWVITSDDSGYLQQMYSNLGVSRSYVGTRITFDDCSVTYLTNGLTVQKPIGLEKNKGILPNQALVTNFGAELRMNSFRSEPIKLTGGANYNLDSDDTLTLSNPGRSRIALGQVRTAPSTGANGF